MHIDTEIGCFSDFKTLYRVMCEDGIDNVYVTNAAWWGAKFIHNEILTKNDIYHIITDNALKNDCGEF